MMLAAAGGSILGWGLALAVLHAEDASLDGARGLVPIFVEAAPGPSPGLPESLADLAEKLSRSVVILSAGSRRDPSEAIYATGFVISEAGYVVTTDTLIGRALNLRGKLASGHDVPLTVVDRDPMTDLALLEIPDEVALPPLEPAPLGDSDAIRVGEWLVTLGQSDGETPSLAKGILAGRDRSSAEVSGNPARLLQLDMPLLSSFAGGPVIDMRGRVVGIVASPQDVNALRGIASLSAPMSFALPINDAKESILQLLERRPKRKVWLGVRVRPTTASELREGVPIDGALIEDVIVGSPAEGAGLRKGDVIVRYDGREVHAYSDLTSYVSVTPAGREVSLIVLREGRSRSLRALISEQEPPARATEPPWGFEYADLDSGLRARFGMDGASTGVVVTEVSPQGAAWRADLQLGDILLQVNRARVRGAAGLAQRLARSSPIVLLVQRGDATRFVVLEP